MGFWQIFTVNIKTIYRNRSGVFWTLIMPVVIYVSVSVLPLPNLGNSNNSYPDYLLGGIMAMVIMQGGIYTLAYWMIDLRARGVIKRFQVTPLRKSDLLVGVLLARTTVVLIQILLLSFVGKIFFHATIAGSPIWIFFFGVLGALAFLPVGLLISTWADSYESAAPITAAIGLPLVFLGNIFYPSSSLPQSLRIISNFLPITYLSDGLRQVYLIGATPAVWKDMIILIIWIVFVTSITMNRFKFRQ